MNFCVLASAAIRWFSTLKDIAEVLLAKPSTATAVTKFLEGRPQSLIQVMVFKKTLYSGAQKYRSQHRSRKKRGWELK